MSELDEAAQLHRHTWELIPWVVNGSASEPQRRQVEAHLQTCADCRSEFAFQQQLRSAVRQERRADADPQPALQRLWQRIDAEPLPAPRAGRRRSLLLPIMAAALVLETIGLTWLASPDWLRPQTGAYRTLSATPALTSAATIRLVPAPELRLDQLQALLREAQLRIVDGPSEAGVYALAPAAPAPPALATTLALLRAHPGVRFAEPLADVNDDPRNAR